MNSRSFVATVFCAGLLLPGYSSLYAQQAPISPLQVEKLKSALGSMGGAEAGSSASPERFKKLMEEYKLQKSQSPSSATTEQSEQQSDDIRGADTVKRSMNGAFPKPTFSMYENIINSVNVHPDSLLKNVTAFGSDLFSSAKQSSFKPSDFASVPADYPISAGDEIVVLLWGRINEENRLRVSRDGSVNLPRIGPVPVAGMPFEVMEKNILKRVTAMEGVHASVSMGELRTVGVYVVGEVATPGFYTLSSLTSVTNALFAAGGVTKRGSLRTIQLKRGGRAIATIDFYDFLLSGSDRSGLRLQSGDVILVPICESMAAIVGNVRRSALYELKGKTSLSDLIALAGGLSPTAWKSRIQIERFMNNSFQAVLDVASEKDKIPNFQILDGDIVKVFPVLDMEKNAVYLNGNVLRPGKYEFREGLKISDLVPDFSSLLPETYFDYGIIMRQDSVSFLNSIVPFNVMRAIENPSSNDNLLLKRKDQVVIYNRDFFEPDRTVSIGGSVTSPGTFKLLENMKIWDLILQAGGLRDEASPFRGELYRRKMQDNRVETEKVDFCVSCAMKDDPQHNLLLQRSDRIYIRQRTGWEEERKVILTGQFMYPGTYVIFENETLGDLLKRAGGFKDNAYVAAAVFIRRSVREQERLRREEYEHQLETQILSLSAEAATKEKTEEAQGILAQQQAIRQKMQETSTNIGRIVIDLTRPENYNGFALRDGDSLFVPRNINTVSVIGEVYNPSTFVFKGANASPWFYIESAGGLKKSADKKHIYVIKANGSVITNNMQRISSIALAPGDAVIVPQRLEYANAHKLFVDTIDAFFKVASTLAIVITMIVTLK